MPGSGRVDWVQEVSAQHIDLQSVVTELVPMPGPGRVLAWATAGRGHAIRKG